MSARLSEVSTTTTKEEIIDALQVNLFPNSLITHSYPNPSSLTKNYEIIKEIGRGTKSIVHLAICKKGRLRNRKVALKEVWLYLS
jgi:hypothetical protein